MISSKKLGNTGEELAKNYCQSDLKIKIIDKNYKCGQFGEIDLIGFKDNTYYFIEVKTRTNDYFMDIYEVVDKRKQNALVNAAKYYIIKNKLNQEYSYTIDLITINQTTNNLIYYSNIIAVNL